VGSLWVGGCCDSCVNGIDEGAWVCEGEQLAMVERYGVGMGDCGDGVACRALCAHGHIGIVTRLYKEPRHGTLCVCSMAY
jgi:hypothetical protein